jgi:hypothetical protein
MSKSKLLGATPAETSKYDNDDASTGITLEQIRQAGICRQYEKYKNQGLSARECLKKTANFARNTERHVKGMLTDKKTATKKKDQFVGKILKRNPNG